MNVTEPLFLFLLFGCVALATLIGILIGIDISWWRYTAPYGPISPQFLRLLDCQQSNAQARSIPPSKAVRAVQML
jgi:hypothetical protein